MLSLELYSERLFWLQVKGLPANHGSLYKDAVEDLFRRCESNPKAHFEETRYVKLPAP